MPGRSQTVIESADQLPLASFAAPLPVAELVQDRAAMDALRAAVAADLGRILGEFELRDRSTLGAFHRALASVALLAGDEAQFAVHVARQREYEDKEALRLTKELVRTAIVRAGTGPEAGERLRGELRAALEPLPFDLVADVIRELVGEFETVSPNFILGLLATIVQPQVDGRGGRLDRDLAFMLIDMESKLRIELPHKPVVVEELRAYLAAHTEVAVDIWASRDITLAGATGLAPVVVAAWDSGLDAAVYGEQTWVNDAEVAGNDRDDDGNGWVDDVHGVAWTTDGQYARSAALLLDVSAEERARLEPFMRGFDALAAGIDSPEAAALRRQISEMAPDDVGPFFEALMRYAYYAHGTHVAGIMVAGNPAARVMGARLGFPVALLEPLVTSEEQARLLAKSFTDAVAYFRANRVRVVNMSWGIGVATIESGLATAGVGADEAERRALAGRLFSILEQALQQAITSAPEILFVAAAGNSNDSNQFNRDLPSSMRLDNLLVVGAVDQAGRETSFTTIGNVDVYASGYQVESRVPGGALMPMSGTSMASPQVANLAGKLLALRPDLPVAELRQLIVNSATETTLESGRTIRLLHPAATRDALAR
jgi:hypothetical protein